MKEIILSNKSKTKVDNNLYPLLNSLRWGSNKFGKRIYPAYGMVCQKADFKKTMTRMIMSWKRNKQSRNS